MDKYQLSFLMKQYLKIHVEDNTEAGEGFKIKITFDDELVSCAEFNPYSIKR